MSHARDLIYSRVNKLGDDMARYGPPAPWQKMIEAGGEEDDYLHGLLNQVEDDRAHAEAEKLRSRATSAELSTIGRMDPAVALHTAGVLRAAAKTIDPYETRDGQLVRKSDGQPVTL